MHTTIKDENCSVYVTFYNLKFVDPKLQNGYTLVWCSGFIMPKILVLISFCGLSVGCCMVICYQL